MGNNDTAAAAQAIAEGRLPDKLINRADHAAWLVPLEQRSVPVLEPPRYPTRPCLSCPGRPGGRLGRK